MRKTTMVGAVVLTLVLCAGCKKDEANGSAAPDAVVEKSDQGKVSLSVGGDGKVKALVETADGKPATKTATGSVTFKTPSGQAKPVPLAFDASSGALVAAGPKLEGDLTEISYAVVADGKALNGTLHVPAGGTLELAGDAKGDAVAVADGKKGPHGGIVQVVGDDRLEIVSDGKEEVRVYALDADLKPVSVEQRKVKLGVVGDHSEIVELTAEPGGKYLFGTWHLKGDPSRITVVEQKGADTKVVLVGFRPGHVLVVGPSAPKVKLVALTVLEPREVVVVKAHDNGRGRGRDQVVLVTDDDRREDIKIKLDGHGKGKFKVK
jgi:hypothetical protein